MRQKYIYNGIKSAVLILPPNLKDLEEDIKIKAAKYSEMKIEELKDITNEEETRPFASHG
jgi:hypothetical protein